MPSRKARRGSGGTSPLTPLLAGEKENRSPLPRKGRGWVLGSPRRWLAVLGLAVATLALAAPTSAQGLPPFPTIYRGTVMIGGNPAPDGTKVTARILDWVSPEPLPEDRRQYTSGGSYELTVGPPEQKYVSQRVSFFSEGVLAAETPVFTGAMSSASPFTTQDLNVPTLPLTGALGTMDWWPWAVGVAGAAMVAFGLLAWRPARRGPGERLAGR